ncbi:MAG: AMP-binding protein [Sphingobium sp.]
MTKVSLGRRLTDIATADPDRAAVILVRMDGRDEQLSYRELDRRSNRAARILAARGVTSDSRVTLALSNTLHYFIATFAIWKLGACVFPMRFDLPEWERSRLIDAARPTHVIGAFETVDLPQVRPEELDDAGFDDGLLPDITPNPYKVNATGGSTGVSKIVVPKAPGVVDVQGATADNPAGVMADEIRFVAGPLYHYGPSLNAITALNAGATEVILEKFDPALFLRSVQQYRIGSGMLVPTMLYRVLEFADRDNYDVGSLRQLMIAGAKCADWVFEKATTVFGPERVWVGYGGTENIGRTGASGAEWLAHPGTTGRPVDTDLVIRSEEGDTLPVGEIGEVWMRPHWGVETDYANAELRMTADGFATYGDLGWVDADGYLYIADRRKDLIVSGGANIYPAEVEAALLEHPDIEDVAVVGIPSIEWGATVHAVIVPAGESEPVFAELKEFCREKLAPYKIPKTFATTAALPRDELGKLRRSALVEA